MKITVETEGKNFEEIIQEVLNQWNGRNDSLKNETANLEKEKQEVSVVLIKLGISVSTYGYVYLRDAILYIMKHGKSSVVKEVYPDVAKNYGTSSDRVERDIRYSIIASWEKKEYNMDTLNEVFKGRNNYEEKNPTNQEYIYGIVEYLKCN